MRVLMIDNYDSFTYNLVHYVGELGADVETVRNDKITLDEIEQKAPDAIILSPGPCTPNEAGICLSLIDRFAGKIPLFTGGTGLYLKALTEGLFAVEDAGEDESIRTHLAERLKKEGREKLFAELRAIDPESAARIHINDTQRLLRALEIYKMTGKSWSERLHSQKGPAVRFAEMLQIGLTCSRQTLYERIELRTHAMFAKGLIEEAEKLQKMYSPELPSMQAIGYRHANNFLAGIWDREETIRLLARDTRRYAKRQMTWFSRNKAIEWYARDDHQGIIRRVETWLATA